VEVRLRRQHRRASSLGLCQVGRARTSRRKSIMSSSIRCPSARKASQSRGARGRPSRRSSSMALHGGGGPEDASGRVRALNSRRGPRRCSPSGGRPCTRFLAPRNRRCCRSAAGPLGVQRDRSACSGTARRRPTQLGRRADGSPCSTSARRGTRQPGAVLAVSGPKQRRSASADPAPSKTRAPRGRADPQARGCAFL
jgi:hypothetical protein